MKNKIINFIRSRIDLINYILIRILLIGISFVTNLFLVRRLTEHNYGIYALVLTILGLLVTFGFGWTSSSLMYFGVEERMKYGTLNRTFWARNIILIVTYILITIIFIIFHKKIDNYLTEPISIDLFIWMTIRIFTDYLSSYFLAIEKRIVSSLVSLSTKIIILFLIVFTTVTLKKVMIYSIISELVGGIWIFKINKKDFGKFIFDKEIFKEVFSFGMWQLFGFSGLYLVNFGDNLVIKHFLTIEDVGIYNISYQLFIGMAGFSYLFSSYFAPQVVKAIKEKDINTLNNIYRRDRILLCLLLSIPHIFVLVFASKIVTIFYGVKYSGAIPSLIVLTFESLMQYFTVFNIVTYNCFKKYNILQLFNILRAILNILLDILFVPKFGIVGAAYGTFLSFMLISIIETIYGEYILIRFKKRSYE